MLCLCFIFLFLLIHVEGELLYTNDITRGGKNIVTVYPRLNADQMSYAITQITNDLDVFVVALKPDSNGYQKQVCMNIVSTVYGVFPRGCDRNLQLETYNCNQKSAVANEAFLQDNWQEMLGPVFIVDSQSTRRLDQIENQRELARATFAYVVTGMLPPFCAARLVTPVNINMTDINITCSTGFTGLFKREPFDAAYSPKYETWSSGVHRLLVLGTEGIFMLFYETIWLNSTEVFHIGEVDAQNASFSNGTAWCIFDIVPLDDFKFKLIKPPIPDQLTFYKGIYPPFYYFSRTMILGRQSFDNGLFYPWIPNNIAVGGKILFQSRDIIPIKFRIKPQPEFQDYYPYCDRFYPASEFFSVNGVLQSRNSELRCYAPFINPAAIEADSTADEKARQCKMLGGYTDGFQTMCAMDASQTYCKLGYLFFNERCYYKWDPIRDQKSLQRDAGSVCTNLFKHNTVATKPDEYLESWLLRAFVFWSFRTEVRLIVNGNQCKCFRPPSVDGLIIGDSDPCSCETLSYPLCSYSILDYHLLISDYGLHPDNMYTMKYGQEGRPHDGSEFPIQCLPGSGGEHCMEFFCPPPDIILNANGTVTDPALLYYLTCYNSHGTCDHKQHWVCICDELHGPPANRLNQSDPAINYPCACPQGVGPQQFPNFGYIVNNETFSVRTNRICNFQGAGACIVTPGFEGVCESLTSLDMNPDSITKYKADWQGKALTCPKAKILDTSSTGFRFSEAICGGNGLCGPFAENDNLAILQGMETYTLYKEETINKNGCVCVHGTGIACTSVAVEELPFIAKSGNAYLMETKKRVVRVVVRSILYALKQDVCGATGVFLSNNGVDKEVSCGSSNNGTFYCPPNLNATYWYVIVEPITGRCKVKIYDEDFPICGYYPNKFASRFFANDEWNSYNNYRKDQPFEFAKFGSTQTQCMCGPNHEGERCANGVSAITQEATISCGQNTEPKRGTPSLNGCIDSIVGEFQIEGEASQCASRDGAMCGGFGVCRNTSFPYGRCEYDLLEYENDALSRSIDAGVIANQIDLLYSFTVVLDTYFVINNRTWHFFPGQVLVIDTLLSNLSVPSYPERKIGLNLTYDCPIDINSAQVVMVNITVEQIDFVCDLSDIGIPACYQVIEHSYLCDIDCGFDNVCGDHKGTYPCIKRINGYVPVTETEELESGTYIWTYAIAGFAIPNFDISTGSISFPFGKLDCSNPFHRSIDSGLKNAGLQTELQCKNEKITPYSQAKGEGFGLFDDVLFQFDDFVDGYRTLPFTEDVFWYIASLFNYEKCDKEGIYNFGFWDKYMVALVQSKFQNETSTTISSENATVIPVYYTNGTSNLDQGHYGFTYLHEEYILSYPSLNLVNMTYNKQRGYFIFVPGLNLTEELRAFSYTAGFEGMRAIQILGVQGRTCTTYQRPIHANETLLFDCIDALQKESLGISLQRILALNPSQYIPISQLLQNATNAYVMFISMDPDYEIGTFLTSDFKLQSRAGLSYNDLWNSLTYQVMQLKQFPYNQAYKDGCSRDYEGSFSPIQYPQDMDFIVEVYSHLLSPRRCASDLQCKSFSETTREGARPYKCIYPTTRNRRWLNGNIGFGLRGDEGGCDCSGKRGHINHQTFCTTCEDGFGPQPVDTDPSWAYLISQQEIYGSPIYFNDTLQPCTVPLFRGYPCGATSFISFDPNPTPTNITVTLFNKQFLKRCKKIWLTTNNMPTAFETMDQFEISIHLQSFRNSQNNTFNVIRDRMFLDGEEVEFGACPDKNTCELLGIDTTLFCERVIDTRSSVQEYDNGFWTEIISSK